MTALLERLPVYKTIILKSIASSESIDDILVCLDFIDLFSQRFRPFLPTSIFVSHSRELYNACHAKRQQIINA
jgi:hypothetical protein